jgi:hypothetical protein
MRSANGRFLGMTTAGWRPKVLPLHQLTMPDSFSVEQKSRNPVRFPDLIRRSYAVFTLLGGRDGEGRAAKESHATVQETRERLQQTRTSRTGYYRWLATRIQFAAARRS